jgi:PAS domain S-box-containing protein
MEGSPEAAVSLPRLPHDWSQRKWLSLVSLLSYLAMLAALSQLLLIQGWPLPLIVALITLALVVGIWLFVNWVFRLIAALQTQGELALADAHRERARLLAVLDAPVDGIYVVGTDERISLANRTLEGLLGLPRDQILGQPCFGHTGSRTRDGRLLCESACPFREPIRHRYPTEIQVPTAYGRRAMEIASGRILGSTGEIEGVVHVLRDLTARKEVEQLQDEFISLVSHELKTPLNHIKGFASTLLQEDVEWDRESQRDFLQTIDQEADRLTRLVENILEMARLANAERGTVLDLDWYAPADLIHTVVERFQSLAPHRQVELIPPETLPPVRCDRRTIEVLFSNLLENAIKYSPPATPIRVQLRAEGDLVHLAVTDEGPGIPPDVLPRVFERFYRGNNRQQAPGTGLGLAISRRIAQVHGGDLTVESTLGRGTTFTLTLPVGGPADAQAPHPRR